MLWKNCVCISISSRRSPVCGVSIKRNMKKGLPLNRFRAKTMRVNKIDMKNFLKKYLSFRVE